MSRIAQGDGSSPSTPVSKKDRKRLAKYDRLIHFLDQTIWWTLCVERSGLQRTIKKRNELDAKRRELRHKMKGVR